MPVGLAPNPRSRFRAHDIDHAVLDKLETFTLPFNGDTQLRGYTAIDEPSCQVIIEDFMPGHEFTWVFTHDEYQYCLSGEIEITVWLPPLYAESSTVILKAGSVYTFPVGARMQVKVLGDVPFRHICFCPPSPGYSFPTYEELKG
jgi:quercetin dioxygenase-like cupin family protein